MEVCSSTEMGAPGASHLGTGDHGPKTDRSRPRSVPVKRACVHERSSSRLVGQSEIVLLIAEERAVCSGRLKRKRDTFLPLLEHAIADLHEFRVRFHVGVQFL